MDWTEKLRPASFRGIPFEVEVSDRQGGRAFVVHEYPARDLPYVEDLGLSPRVFRVEAYVVGDDVFARRDRLLDALEQPGPGLLVHPYYGSVEVCATEVRTREHVGEGRVARFLLEFTRSAEPVSPETFVNGEAEAASAAEATGASAAAAFDSSVVVAGVPEWVGNGARNSAIEVLGQLRRTDFSGGELDEVSALLEEIDETVDAVFDLLLQSDFSKQYRHVLNRVQEVFSSKLAVVDAYLGLESYRCQQGGFLSELGEQADRNALAVELLNRAECLAQATSAAAGVDWTSSDQALAMREDLSNRIDSLSEQVDDETYSTLQALQTALLQSVPSEDQSLPRIETVTPRVQTSSILMAWRYYGSVAQEPEIVARNRPRWPAFLSAGEPLQLLVEAV